MKLLRQFGLIIMVFVLLLPAIAQEPAFENQHDFGNNVFIRYPEGWDIFIDEGNDTHVYSEETDILILFEAYDSSQTLMGYLNNLYERTRFDSSQSLKEESVFIGALGDVGEIASYTYDDNADGDVFQRYIFVIPLGENTVVLASVTPLFAAEIEEIGTVLDILATLQFGPDENQTDTKVVTETPVPFTPTPEPTVDPTVPRSITWDNQLSLLISGDWEADTSEEGLNYIVNEDFTVVFFSKMIEDERQDTHANYIREIYQNTDFLIDASIAFDEDLFYFVDLPNDPDALAYKYTDSFDGEDFEQLLVAVQSSSTMLVVAVAYPLQTDSFTDTDLNSIYEVLGTLNSP